MLHIVGERKRQGRLRFAHCMGMYAHVPPIYRKIGYNYVGSLPLAQFKNGIIMSVLSAYYTLLRTCM